MSPDFEFLLALFGLLYALIVAELALKFADAIDLHSERPMAVLTPALAFLFLTRRAADPQAASVERLVVLFLFPRLRGRAHRARAEPVETPGHCFPRLGNLLLGHERI